MNSHKMITVIVCIIVVFVTIVVFLGQVTYQSRVILNGKVYFVDVADTTALLQKGLSGRESLLDNEGMFFEFDKEGNHGIWMKDMKFPIDIIWIDKDYKIVHIERSILPQTYPKIFYPVSPALYVLEISAGQSNLLNIKNGNTAKFVKKLP